MPNGEQISDVAVPSAILSRVDRGSRRWIGLGVPLLLAGAFWTYWRQTTPEWELALIPVSGPNALVDVYPAVLGNPKVAREVGYTEGQRAQDESAQKRRKSRYDELESRIKALYAKGVGRYEIGAVYRREIEKLRATADTFPSLSSDQRHRLLKYAIRWAGPWLLMDRSVAGQIGLSEAQRLEIERAADDVRRYRGDEYVAFQRWSSIVDGAPARAMLANEDARRLALSSERLWDGDPELKREYHRLTEQTYYSPTWTPLPKLDGPRYDLVVRRTVAFRREEEARILASLTPNQRAAWERFTSAGTQ